MKILEPYRKKIDSIDRELITLLRARYDVIDEVSVIKDRENIDAVLQDRVDEVRDNAEKFAGELELDSDFIRELWAQIIAHSCEREDIYMKDNK